MTTPPFGEVDESLDGARVAVTGACGFVGSHVVPMLVASGAEVLAIDQSLGKRPIVAQMAKVGLVDFHAAGPWPYRIDDALTEQLRACDAVVHLAFSAIRSTSTHVDATLEAQQNLLGTLNLLACLDGRVDQVCLASSAMVYSPAHSGLQAEPAVGPSTPYGVAKLATEQMAALIGEERGLVVTSLRLSTVYGRWETAPRAIPNFIRSVLSREPIIVRGGADLRDYVHVNDVARAVVAALAVRRPGVFNVGTGIPTRTDFLADLVAGMGSVSVPIHRYEDDRSARSLVCDPTLARQELGFEATVPLRLGVRDAFRWAAERADQPVGGVHRAGHHRTSAPAAPRDAGPWTPTPPGSLR